MSLCNQKISLQKNLRKHSSEIHEVKKPLKCDICDHCLKIHMLPVRDENKTFKCELVITALLTRAVRLNTLLQFTMLRNHSNVTFVTPVFTKRNTLLRCNISTSRSRGRTIDTWIFSLPLWRLRVHVSNVVPTGN